MLKEANLVDSNNRVIMPGFITYLDADTRNAFKINGTPLTIHFLGERGWGLNTYELHTTPESLGLKNGVGDVLLGQFTVLEIN